MPENLNLSVFKYPLGAIRCVQFLFIIIAIISVNSWGLDMEYHCSSNTTTPTYSSFKQGIRTFSLSNFKLTGCDNKGYQYWQSEDSASGSSGFFYFVNVAALIFVLVATFIYVVFWRLYETDKRIALADFCASALFFILFFFCSSIWWAGSNTIGRATSAERLQELFTMGDWANQPVTYDNHIVNNGKLAISVLCNWVCVFCFAFNCWFIWKEVVPRDSSSPTSVA